MLLKYSKGIVEVMNSERGYLLIFFALGIAVFIGIVSMALNVSYSRSLKTELQDATDSAAHAAASVLCSTKACYEDAVGIAITMIEEKTSGGLIKEKDFDNTTDALTWTNGDATITIHRGRWWPDGASFPYDEVSPFFDKNEFFEDFDHTLDDNSTWQETYPQLPDFFAANAIYVEAEVTHKNTFLNLLKISEAKIKTSSFAIAGNVSDEVCVAPFALPVCSLINNAGEYDSKNDCLKERFFTESKRYCDEGDNTCGIVPGSLYRAVPNDAAELPANLWDSEVEYYTQDNCGGSACRDYWSPQIKHSCDFRPPTDPEITSAADFFGVVGIPQNSATSTYSASTESHYQAILSRNTLEGRGCVSARIGDDFSILGSGLTATDSANEIASIFSAVAQSEEMFGSKYSVIHNSLIPRNKDFIKVTTASFDSMQAHEDLSCSTNNTRFGLCNSQLFYFNTHCFTNQYVFPPDNISEILYSENMISCANYPSEDTTNRYQEHTMGTRVQKIPEQTTFLANSPTWKVAIPVIAPKGSGEMSERCTGVAGNTGPGVFDPAVDSSKTYTIVGFVNMNFFDYDIGASPPERFYPEHLQKEEFKPYYLQYEEVWDTKHWDSAEEPWGFLQDRVAGGVSCNMMKATQECSPGLASVPQFRRENYRKITIAAPIP